MAISGTTLGTATTTNVREVLLRLLGHTSDERDGILSLYVDLDPSQFATAPARAAEVTSLLDEAARMAPSSEWNDALDRLRAMFVGEEFEIPGAHGLACFCDASGDLSEIVLVPRVTERFVAFARTPYVRPLVSALPHGDWIVMLVNRRSHKVFHGTREQIKLVTSYVHELPFSNGDDGAQPPNERLTDNDIDEHIRLAADDLEKLARNVQNAGVLLAVPTDLRQRLEHAMSKEVCDMVRGFLDLDIEHATTAQILDLAQEHIDRCEDEYHHELLGRLESNIGMQERAAVGLQPVLDALVEQRVDTLIVNQNFRAGGACCPQCGWMAGPGNAPGGQCPADGTTLEHHDDIVEAAFEAAVRQDAHIATIGRDYPAVGVARSGSSRGGSTPSGPQACFTKLEQMGSIGALLRY